METKKHYYQEYLDSIQREEDKETDKYGEVVMRMSKAYRIINSKYHFEYTGSVIHKMSEDYRKLKINER